MKSERRHELEKNELADRLASGIESTRSYLPFIVGGLALVAVLAIGWGVYSGYARKKASVAWTEFYFNLTRGDADSFVDLAEEYPKSAAASWARQIAGDNFLQRGINSMYSNRTEATELIGKAIDAFEEVNQQTSNPDLRAKALLGLAQAHESLGEVEKAVNYYQQLTKATSQLGLIAKANERLAFLTSQAGKDFYSWFSQLDPKPDAPITLPSDMLVPPTTPDLQFGPTDTDLNSSLTPPAEPAVDNTSAPDLPAASQVPAIGEVPAVPSSASEQPATSEAAPVTEVPAASADPAAANPAAADPAADVDSAKADAEKAPPKLELQP